MAHTRPVYCIPAPPPLAEGVSAGIACTKAPATHAPGASHAPCPWCWHWLRLRSAPSPPQGGRSRRPGGGGCTRPASSTGRVSRAGWFGACVWGGAWGWAVRVRVYRRMFVFVCIDMAISTYIYRSIWIYTCLYIYIYIYIYLYLYLYRYRYMSIYIYVCINLCMYV